MAGTTAAVIGAGSAVAGAIGSSKASKAQASAAKDAANAQQDAAAQMRADLGEYRDLGSAAINPLWSALGYKSDKFGNMTMDPNAALNQTFAFDASNLAGTPGYQFTLNQGLKSTQNALASQGLGLSGAQAKGLSNYATGLAQNTYNDQYNNALSTFNTNYQVASNRANNLANLVNSGQNAAAQTGQANINAANNAGNYLTQAGNAQAAGYTGMANAVSNAGNNYLLYNALYK